MAGSMPSPECNLPSVSTVNKIADGVLAERAACAMPANFALLSCALFMIGSDNHGRSQRLKNHAIALR